MSNVPPTDPNPPAPPVPTPPPAPPAAPAPPAQAPTPPPADQPDTDWRAEARKWEQRAKENREAAEKLAALEQQQMTEAERQAAATAKALKDAEDARAEATRYRVAAAHQVTEEYFELLGTGDEAAVTERAKRVQELLAAKAENVQLKADIELLKAGKPLPASRPIADLKPGATPENAPNEGDVLYNSLFPAS